MDRVGGGVMPNLLECPTCGSASIDHDFDRCASDRFAEQARSSAMLKKIEEKYQPDGEGYAKIPPVRDFLKLALALDDLLTVLDTHEPHEISTDGYRRVLAEVAGGEE